MRICYITTAEVFVVVIRADGRGCQEVTAAIVICGLGVPVEIAFGEGVLVGVATSERVFVGVATREGVLVGFAGREVGVGVAVRQGFVGFAGREEASTGVGVG